VVETVRTGVVRRTLEVEVSPEELAAAFLDMNSLDEAEALNRIGAAMFPDGGPGWGLQLLYVADDLDRKGWGLIDYLQGCPRKVPA